VVDAGHQGSTVITYKTISLCDWPIMQSVQSKHTSYQAVSPDPRSTLFKFVSNTVPPRTNLVMVMKMYALAQERDEWRWSFAVLFHLVPTPQDYSGLVGLAVQHRGAEVALSSSDRAKLDAALAHLKTTHPKVAKMLTVLVTCVVVGPFAVIQTKSAGNRI
jgi:hypothetical protein